VNLGGWLSSTPMNVGLGSACQTVTVEKSEGLGSGVETELSKEVETTVVVSAIWDFDLGPPMAPLEPEGGAEIGSSGIYAGS
jgi:hypothetical protein